MDEGQNLNNGGSGLGAAGGFDAFQNNNTFQNAGVGMQGSNSVGGMIGNDAPGAGGGIGVSGPIVSSSDDVVLNGGGDDSGQKSRKRLLLGVAAVVVFFALVAVGVFAMWKGGVFGGGKKEEKTALLNSIEQGQKNVNLIENFFEHIYDGDVSFELAYRNENFVNSLGESVTSFNDFCNEIKNSSRNALNEETKNLLVKMNDICERRTRFYNEMSKIFATFSVVYGSNGIMDTVQELLSNDDEYIASLALQFLDYYTKRDRLLLDIENSGCGSWFSENVICVNLYDEYYGNEGFVSNGDIVANIAAKIMPIGEYGETFEITNLINELLYENGVLENA